MEAIIPTPLNSTPARPVFEGGVDQFDSGFGFAHGGVDVIDMIDDIGGGVNWSCQRNRLN
jgi:hypothetical protein